MSSGWSNYAAKPTDDSSRSWHQSWQHRTDNDDSWHCQWSTSTWDTSEGTATWNAVKFQPEPARDVASDGVDMVWLSNTVDTSKWRSIPMMHENEFQRGIEWYMYWKGGDEPVAKIRPSQAQFTAIRELLQCRVFYVDLGLLHSHDHEPIAGQIGSIKTECRTEQKSMALQHRRIGRTIGRCSSAPS